jgi:hypothetical protein
MTTITLNKRFTVEQAEEILRIAKMKCPHDLVQFKRTFGPRLLEDIQARKPWESKVICETCHAYASTKTYAPICESCSCTSELAIMRLVNVHDDPRSRYGKIYVFTCDKCKRNEDIVFESGYS